MSFNKGQWVKWSSGAQVNTGWVITSSQSLLRVYQVSGDDSGLTTVDKELDLVSPMMGSLEIEDYDTLIDIALVTGDREWFTVLSKKRSMKLSAQTVSKMVRMA